MSFWPELFRLPARNRYASCCRSVQGLLEVTASRLEIVADRRHGLSRAVRLHFRRSVENQQIFDSSSEASRLLQPPRHLSSGIRLTEQTACCPPAPSDSSSFTGGCDRSSQSQEQCTTYTSKKRPRRKPWLPAPGPLYPSGSLRSKGQCSVSKCAQPERSKFRHGISGANDGERSPACLGIRAPQPQHPLCGRWFFGYRPFFVTL